MKDLPEDHQKGCSNFWIFAFLVTFPKINLNFNWHKFVQLKGNKKYPNIFIGYLTFNQSKHIYMIKHSPFHWGEHPFTQLFLRGW